MQSRIWISLVWLFVSVAALGFWVFKGEPHPSVTLDGVPVADDGAVKNVLGGRLYEAENRKVRLVLSQGAAREMLGEWTLRELGVHGDDEDAVAQIRSAWQRCGEKKWFASAAANQTCDVHLLWSVDLDVLAKAVDSVKRVNDRAPVAARLDLERRQVIDGVDGRYVDLYALAETLRTAADDPKQREVSVPCSAVKPKIARAAIEAMSVDHVVGTYETHFARAGKEASRARNIEVAAHHLNGVLLAPGSVFSFNEAVGARSEDNGFQKAGEIFKGELVEGIGGGTCQVASTLHAAAFFGGLEIQERSPHSRPSAYIQMGLDATVVYPTVDLRIRNSFSFPIVIHAKVDGTSLVVELLGKEKPVNVTFARETVESFPYGRKIVEESWVKEPNVKQKGIRGFRIRRFRTIASADGKRRVEATTDFYPPTIEIYKVPQGFDPSELPPLPEEPSEKPAGGPA